MVYEILIGDEMVDRIVAETQQIAEMVAKAVYGPHAVIKRG
jgi:hypothetical protein